MVLDLATPDLDITTWVTGMPLVSVTARARTQPGRVAATDFDTALVASDWNTAVAAS
ncbi:hypothetical protein [Micromonospora rosaria]|uniref:hypothetical protein n=1 Tax=Micromonospora rosaria TaxID=47874 RepID=UPI000A87336F|nr:hypothetical protein [Micromonospora rosaria]